MKTAPLKKLTAAASCAALFLTVPGATFVQAANLAPEAVHGTPTRFSGASGVVALPTRMAQVPRIAPMMDLGSSRRLSSPATIDQRYTAASPAFSAAREESAELAVDVAPISEQMTAAVGAEASVMIPSEVSGDASVALEKVGVAKSVDGLRAMLRPGQLDMAYENSAARQADSSAVETRAVKGPVSRGNYLARFSAHVSDNWNRFGAATATMLALTPVHAYYGEPIGEGILGGPITWTHVVWTILGVAGGVTLFRNIFTVPQQHVAVIERFGKFYRIASAGLAMKVPFIDSVEEFVTLQNQSREVEFTATTDDQAQVNFKALLVYRVKDEAVDTIKKAAYAFVDQDSFIQTLTKSIEAQVRGFVAHKKQADVLKLREDIVADVKAKLAAKLGEWGYVLDDVQLNDITFDDEIMKSMAKVVASANLLQAARNEGEATMIKKTKEAEARGRAIEIEAGAEKAAAKLRGEGVSDYRSAVAQGMKDSSDKLEGVPNSELLMLLSTWVDALVRMAENPKATLFMDGNVDSGIRSIRQLMASMSSAQPAGSADGAPSGAGAGAKPGTTQPRE